MHLSKILTPAPSLALALVLSACSTPGMPAAMNVMDNPLFAERYADEIVERMVEFSIQADPILEDAAKASVIDSTRLAWLQKAQEARKIRREGMYGQFIPIGQYAAGDALYVNDTLFFGTTFDVVPGPAIHVYITTGVDPRDVTFPEETSLDLGPLQAPYGIQQYAVPHQENPQLYRTVVLWDTELQTINAFAQLAK